MTHSETNQTNHSNLFNPIKEILIENFQSHKITEIFPAGPGELTVIVGQSRQGKTAIFRALRWLFYNAPDGADFIRWSATFARVTVEYADGTQVIRYRTSGGINRYIIRKPMYQEQVYEGFGRGAVPLEVQQITGVSPVEIGEGLSLNLNLAEQLDGPFLGNKAVSSTARAKVLGKLAGTEEVDLASKTLGTDIFRWKREQESHDKEIKDTQKKLEGYDYLPEFKANMDKLSGIRDTVKAAMERREKLDALYKELMANEGQTQLHEMVINKLSTAINETHFILISIGANIVRKDQLYSILADSILNSGALEAVQAVIKRTDNLPQAEAFIRATEGQVTRQQQVDKLRGKWKNHVEDECQVDAIISQTVGIHTAAEIVHSMEVQARNKQQAEMIVTQWNKMVYDLLHNERILFETRGIFEAETAFSLAEKDVTQLMQLIPIYRDFETVKSRIWKEEWVLDSTEQIPLADTSLTELYDKMDRKNRLLGVLDKWNKVSGDMAVVDRQMERTRGIGTAEEIVNKAQMDRDILITLLELGSTLNRVALEIESEDVSAMNAEYDIETLQEEYFETLKNAGKCPTCGGDVDRKKLKKVI